MSSLKLIKSRIKSVKNTKKVTKTMELISAIKLQKAVDYALNVKKYSEELAKVAHKAGINYYQLQKEVNVSTDMPKSKLAIVISADRGLAGSYLGNLRRFLVEDFKVSGKADSVILVGKKLFGFLKKQEIKVDAVYKFSEYQDIEKLANDIFKLVYEKYEKNSITSAEIIFTKFHTISKQTIEKVSLISEFNNELEEESDEKEQIDMESSSDEVLDYLQSETLRLKIHSAIAGAIASEHLNRMIAMKNATEASQEIIDALQLIYNKTRQANITREIIEIISGMQDDEQIKNTVSINKIFLNL